MCKRLHKKKCDYYKIIWQGLLNCRTFAAPIFKLLVIMVSTYYKTDSYIDDLLQEVLKYGERMTKERPSSYYEMVCMFLTIGIN